MSNIEVVICILYERAGYEYRDVHVNQSYFSKTLLQDSFSINFGSETALHVFQRIFYQNRNITFIYQYQLNFYPIPEMFK